MPLREALLRVWEPGERLTGRSASFPFFKIIKDFSFFKGFFFLRRGLRILWSYPLFIDSFYLIVRDRMPCPL